VVGFSSIQSFFPSTTGVSGSAMQFQQGNIASHLLCAVIDLQLSLSTSSFYIYTMVTRPPFRHPELLQWIWYGTGNFSWSSLQHVFFALGEYAVTEACFDLGGKVRGKAVHRLTI